MMTMEDGLHDADAIVAGILVDADAEADRIITEASGYAAQTAVRAQEQAATIAREAEAKAEQLTRSILADSEAKAAIERRKRSLALQEKLAVHIVEQARKKIAALLPLATYKEILRTWIVEAAIGLSAETATVNASMDELHLIDDAMLKAAQKDVLDASGKATRLSKVEGDPVMGQGVYLLAEGGRLAYDNRVATRFERNRVDIRKLVYKALFDSRLP